MKKSIIILLAFAMHFIVPGGVTAQTNALIESADSAYAADDFGFAIAGYQEALKVEGSSPQLLYNLGNAYYRDGNIGKAVVSYERALKLDPSFADAAFNLEFVKSKLVDRQRDNATFLDTCFDAVLSFMPSNGWAYLGAALFIAAVALVAVYMYTTPILARKIGFFGSIASFVVAVICITISVVGANRATARDRAVVTSSSVILSTAPRAPRDRNEEVALLHEGSALHVVDSLTNTTDSVASRVWYKVELDSDHKGWAPATSLEII